MLMVGAGGIGCELLKTLALSGFQDIHIVSQSFALVLIFSVCEVSYIGFVLLLLILCSRVFSF